MRDFFSSLPTDEQSAENAYAAYYAVATSECHALANSTSPIYRFARDNMLKALAFDYQLSAAQVAWLYNDGPLCEGPGWGSLSDMVAYGREEGFGLKAIGRAVANCLTCNEFGIGESEPWTHAIDCPFRSNTTR